MLAEAAQEKRVFFLSPVMGSPVMVAVIKHHVLPFALTLR